MSNQKDVCAVTGATGYVGSILLRELQRSRPVVCLQRKPETENNIRWSFESDESVETALRERKVKTLVHAAWDMRTSSLEKMESICVRGSEKLFAAAARAGVERIVFISSISAFDNCRSAYGKSKLAVETMLSHGSNTIFRCGLIYGNAPGGVFGGIHKQVLHGRLLPMIGNGSVPQYLLHESTLAESVCRAVEGEFSAADGKPIRLAHPQPWSFRDLVRSIAEAEQRSVFLIPLPWRLLYGGLRAAEWMGVRTPFRSDSVIGFVNYDRRPDFSLLTRLGIEPRPYEPRSNK
ncbi:MAG: NAD(P)-dependent oxidoreductase [Terracidiphilus sp.]|nr:NAD(P)-dependent oxidoreductase [Terracidiphilus sp.]